MTPMYHTLQKSAIVVVLILLSGCVNLKPVESTTRFYVLGARQGTSDASIATESSGISVGLRRLKMAAYLDTPYIVLRHGTNEVSFSENHRWGEDLEKAISRTVESHLNTHAAIQRVDIAPWPINTSYDYIVQINVLQFEGQTDALPGEDLLRMLETYKVKVHLVADWQIIDPSTNNVIHQDKTDVLLGGWNANIYPNIVTGLDVTLKTMADEIAEALKQL